MAQVAICKPVVSVPVSIRSAGLTEFVRTVPQVIKSDVVGYADTGTINIFEVPGNCLITQLAMRVTTLFDASGSGASATISVSAPNDTGTEVLLASAAGAMAAATGFVIGTGMALTPSSGGYVICTYTATATGGSTVGAFELYMSYIQNVALI